MQFRRSLAHHAHQHGARLIPLKKAKNFVQWCSEAVNPYVLLTDWRETKPCIEALDRQGVNNRPIFTAVFCADTKQQKRVNQWVSSLPERGDPIHVYPDIMSLDQTVPTLLMQALQEVKSSNDTMKKNMQESLVSQHTRLMVNDVQEPPTSQQTCSTKDDKQASTTVPMIQPTMNDVPASRVYGLKLSPPPAGMQPPHLLPLTQAPAAQQGAHEFCRQTKLASKGPEMQMPSIANGGVVALARIWNSFSSAAEIEHALIAAMPQHYED
jgi:hypothetical protein